MLMLVELHLGLASSVKKFNPGTSFLVLVPAATSIGDAEFSPQQKGTAGSEYP